MQHLDRSVSPRTKRMVERALKPLSRVVAKYKRQADSLEGKNHGFLMLPSEIEDTHILMEKLGRLKRELHESVRLIDIDERGFKEIFQHTQSRTTPGRIKTFFSRPNPFEEVVSRASNGLIHALGVVSALLATHFPIVFVVPVYAAVCTLKSLLVSRSIIEARP
ncbi:hypothetical protein HYT84_00340, partial [Candidatus Micrarchaeota archaeon]|nr:hypothetical protein [Candidatus Micrarchaeota archaeon]